MPLYRVASIYTMTRAQRGVPCVPQAPELNCTGKGHTLGGATLSKHGDVIIGMLLPLNSTSAPANDATSPAYVNYCKQRAAVSERSMCIRQKSPALVTVANPAIQIGSNRAQRQPCMRQAETPRDPPPLPLPCRKPYAGRPLHSRRAERLRLRYGHDLP